MGILFKLSHKRFAKNDGTTTTSLVLVCKYVAYNQSDAAHIQKDFKHTIGAGETISMRSLRM